MAVEQNLQPAGAGGDELSGVAGTPALGEADANAVGVPGSLLALGLDPVLGHPAGALIVKDLEGEAGHHPLHAEPWSAGRVQRGRVDEDWMLAAIVHPHAVGLPAQHDAQADFAADLLHTAAAAAAAAAAVMSVGSGRAVAARVLAAAVVGVGLELTQAEARALR